MKWLLTEKEGKGYCAIQWRCKRQIRWRQRRPLMTSEETAEDVSRICINIPILVQVDHKTLICRFLQVLFPGFVGQAIFLCIWKGVLHVCLQFPSSVENIFTDWYLAVLINNTCNRRTSRQVRATNMNISVASIRWSPAGGADTPSKTWSWARFVHFCL